MKYRRKCFRVRAVDSPNVRMGIRLRAEHPEWPDEEVERRSFVVPGVLSWGEYLKLTAPEELGGLPPALRAVRIEADWYDGEGAKLYPAAWLDAAHDLWDKWFSANPDIPMRNKRALGMGVDSGEGSAETSWRVVGRVEGIRVDGKPVEVLGVLDSADAKTPNTAIIPGMTTMFIQRWRMRPDQVVFDLGGGGKEHVDRLRAQGVAVRGFTFGESVAPPVKRALEVVPMRERQEQRDERVTFSNRRAEMFWGLRCLLTPEAQSCPKCQGRPGDDSCGICHGKGILGTASKFAIPREDAELRRQMEPIPLQECFDDEGRFKMIPKRSPDPNKLTIEKLIGCSCDRLDSLALGCWAMQNPAKVAYAGAI